MLVTDSPSPADDLALLRDAAQEAARIAMRYFRKNPKVSWKAGQSPVTEADFAVDAYLQHELMNARPGYGWLSEESLDDRKRLAARRTFVVDPIDGTRAFIEGNDVWCVSVAVVENNRPVAGVLNCPARGEVYEAAKGQGAFLNNRALTSKERPAEITFSASKSTMARLPAKWSLPIRAVPHVPSLAYRLAMIASGALDGTFVKPNSHDWDIAAADLILSETGGSLRNADGTTPLFATENPAHHILVAGNHHFIDEMLRVVASVSL